MDDHFSEIKVVIYWAEFMTPFKEQPHHCSTPAAVEEVHNTLKLGSRDSTSLVDTREDAAAPEEEVGCGLVWPTGCPTLPQFRGRKVSRATRVSSAHV